MTTILAIIGGLAVLVSALAAIGFFVFSAMLPDPRQFMSMRDRIGTYGPDEAKRIFPDAPDSNGVQNA